MNDTLLLELGNFPLPRRVCDGMMRFTHRRGYAMKHARLVSLALGTVVAAAFVSPAEGRRIVLQNAQPVQQEMVLHCGIGDEWGGYYGGMVQGMDVPVKFELDLPAAETDDTLTDYRAAVERGRYCGGTADAGRDSAKCDA